MAHKGIREAACPRRTLIELGALCVQFVEARFAPGTLRTGGRAVPNRL
jgi:hypothetical protein